MGPGRSRALPLARPARVGAQRAQPRAPARGPAAARGRGSRGRRRDPRPDRTPGAGARGRPGAPRPAGRRARRPGRLRLRRVRDPPLAPHLLGRAGSARGRHPQGGERPRAAGDRRRAALPEGLLPAAGRPLRPASTSTGRRSSRSTSRPSWCWPRTGRRSASRSRSPAARSRSTSGGSRSGACRSTCSTRSSTRTTPSTAGSRPASTRATRSRGSGSTACSGSAASGRCARSGSSPACCTSTRATRRSRPSSSRRTTSPPAPRSRTRSPAPARDGLHDPHAGARGNEALRAHSLRTRSPTCPVGSGSTTSGSSTSAGRGQETDEWPGMTPLALRLTRRTNAVSRRHGEVAREMWRPLYGDPPADDVPITHVTNGVHLPSFLSPPIRRLLDDHLGDGWLDRAADPATWDAVDGIPDAELWAARNEARRLLVDYVKAQSVHDRLLRGEAPTTVRAAAETFVRDTLTLGFARRIATYKRLFLLTYDPERVRRLFADGPPLQMIVAGKAHPSTTTRSSARGRLLALAVDRDHVPGGLPRGLRPLGRRADRRAAATSGSTSPAAARGERDERHEVGAERRAQPERAGRLVGRGLRRPQRLGDRRRPRGRGPAAQDARHAHGLYDLLEQQVLPLFHDRDERRHPAPAGSRWCARRSRPTGHSSPRPAWSRSTPTGSIQFASGMPPSGIPPLDPGLRPGTP